MAEALVDMVRTVRAALVAFQPEVYSGEDCAVLVEELATLEKVGVAARVRAASWAGEAGAHRQRGFADVSDWLARASGSSTSSAKAALDTAVALQQQPEVKAALETGDLSLAQARELVKTEAELGRDAFLKAVLHDGTDIHTIAHFGRKTSAVLRTALTLGAPPIFDGIKCSVPGCDRRYYLEQDHIDPVANGGLTSFENMRPLCWLHHLIKTEQDRKDGRLRDKQTKQIKRVKRTKRRKRPSTDGPDPP